jgi:hypothetical protein
MGVKTTSKAYDKYVRACKKKKIKPMDFIDFIIEVES